MYMGRELNSLEKIGYFLYNVYDIPFITGDLPRDAMNLAAGSVCGVGDGVITMYNVLEKCILNED